jgi:hypothetical protein
MISGLKLFRIFYFKMKFTTNQGTAICPSPDQGTGQAVLMSYKCAPGQARRKLARDDGSSNDVDKQIKRLMLNSCQVPKHLHHLTPPNKLIN